MNTLIKITHEESKEGLFGGFSNDENEDSVWHGSMILNPKGYQTVCGCALEQGARYVTKEVNRGGITCDSCLEIIKQTKRIKL